MAIQNITSHEAAVRALMRSVSAGIGPAAQLYHMAHYHLGWRDEGLHEADAPAGKQVRPRLALLGARVVGGDAARAVPVAAALQLVHDFTLVHDDIQDRSDLRRGRRTVWTLWGEAQGINVGDAMFAMAHRALARSVAAGVPAEQVVTMLDDFDATVLRICEGQFLDLSFEERLDLDEREYLGMIERKTATLLAASLRLGALAGGGSPETVKTLGELGLALGMAFQIEDDVLGIWGDEAVTGKPAAADLYRRKKSLPVVYALAHADDDDRQQLRTLYAQQEIGAAEVSTMLGVLERCDARGYTERQAASYHQRTQHLMEDLDDCDVAALEELRSVAISLLGRTS